MSSLAFVIRSIEDRLSRYYHFSLLAGAESHLVSKEELYNALGQEATKQPEWNSRGGIWMLGDDSNPDHLFIGLHINDDVAGVLSKYNPIIKLSNTNLDAFCVLVEEISHFHLIANRASQNLQVSKIELEWQGEIDKLLISAMLLEEQSGDPHVLQLARCLFDEASITSDHDFKRYEEASRYAAQFWFNFGHNTHFLNGRIRKILIRAYRASWQQKIAAIASLGIEQAS